MNTSRILCRLPSLLFSCIRLWCPRGGGNAIRDCDRRLHSESTERHKKHSAWPPFRILPEIRGCHWFAGRVINDIIMRWCARFHIEMGRRRVLVTLQAGILYIVGVFNLFWVTGTTFLRNKKKKSAIDQYTINFVFDHYWCTSYNLEPNILFIAVRRSSDRSKCILSMFRRTYLWWQRMVVGLGFKIYDSRPSQFPNFWGINFRPKGGQNIMMRLETIKIFNYIRIPLLINIVYFILL